MPTDNLDSSAWRVFRLFLCELEDVELETVYQHLVSEISTREACDLHCARLFFSSLTSHDLDAAREQLLVERTERTEDAKVLEQLAENRRPPFRDRLDSGFPAHSAGTPLASSRHRSDECVDRAGRRGNQEKTRTMPTYAITEDNRIRTVDPTQQAATNSNAPVFDSATELGRIAADWPLPRLVEIYNGVTGHQQRRFANRKQAVERIWAALQTQAGESNDQNRPSTKKDKKTKPKRSTSPSKKKTAPSKKPVSAKKGGHPASKKASVIAMLKHKRPVALADIMASTGWQAHTVRALLSTLASKDGYKIESAKSVKGLRTYRIAE